MLGEKYKILALVWLHAYPRPVQSTGQLKFVLNVFEKSEKVCSEEWHKQGQGRSQLQAFLTYTMSLTQDFRNPL